MQATASQSSLRLVETDLVSPILVTESEYRYAENLAKRKLARIIEREGDADGERLKPYYLEQLIAEAITETRFSAFTRIVYEQRAMEKEKPTVETAGNS